MPSTEVVCRHCAPGGGPRSYQLWSLREARERVWLSPEVLARRAGSSAATVRRAERGERVHTTTAMKLAQALGVSVRELAEGNEGKE